MPELLEAGHEVIGLDDFSKYGRLTKSYDDHPCYRFVEGDAKDVALLTELAADCDQVVAAAAMIGGISYFHEFAYDLLAENERILASTFDAAIAARKSGHLERIVVVSSSMVYESATVFPTPEGAQLSSPPPISTYGFQKLASEYFAAGAWEQYQLPYTIVRPVQLRRDRGAPGGPRHRHHERQREARPVARGAGPRAQGAQGPGPAAHPRRGQPGPPLHLRRRPGPRHPAGDGVAEGDQRRLQPVDGGVDDGARAGRGDLAQDPRAGRAVPLRVRPAVRARRPAARARRAQGARRARVRGHDDPRRDARRGHPVDPRASSRPGACDRAHRTSCTRAASASERSAPRTRDLARDRRATCPRWIDPDEAVLDIACDRGYFVRWVQARERWATDIRDMRENLPAGCAVRPRLWARAGVRSCRPAYSARYS